MLVFELQANLMLFRPAQGSKAEKMPKSAAGMLIEVVATEATRACWAKRRCDLRVGCSHGSAAFPHLLCKSDLSICIPQWLSHSTALSVIGELALRCPRTASVWSDAIPSTLLQHWKDREADQQVWRPRSRKSLRSGLCCIRILSSSKQRSPETSQACAVW